jgi:hypothetical protein
VKATVDGLVAAVPGATYRQLNHWVQKGYLDVPGHGSGNVRDWPREEIRVARVMARLAAVGIPPALAVKVARGDGQLGDGIAVVVSWTS